MKKIILLTLSLSIQLLLQAQVGINVENPRAMLDIKSTAAIPLPLLVHDANDKELFRVTNDGNVGIGVSSPKVRLDARATTGDGAIAIGMTSQAASTAAAGAIRYNTTGKELEYSNGTVWTALKANPQKALVVARNWTQRVFVNNNVTTTLTNWTSIVDLTNSFTESTGVFKAPRDGVYTATFNIALAHGSLFASRQLEAWWLVNGNMYNKVLIGFPVAGSGVQGISNSITLNLTKNQLLRPALWHNLGYARKLRVNSGGGTTASEEGFNNLSIVEH